MIKFHADRNIKFIEIFKIFFKKENLKNSLEKMYPKKKITLTNYGRSAFRLILEKYKIKNCKVMIPAFICPVFIETFKEYNITPVLIDVELNTFNISERTLKKNLDKDAKCLIINNMNGLPCEIKKIKKMLGKKVLVIEDCAHAFGAKRNGKNIGLEGYATFFSLYKNMPTIQGGFAVTKTRLKKIPKEKTKIKTFVNFIYYIGKISHLYKSFKKDNRLYDKEYFAKKIGIHQPSFLVKKIASYYLSNLSKIITQRQKIAAHLIKNLSGLPISFQNNPNNEHIYTYFSFLLPKKLTKKRMVFIKLLRGEGIVGRIIWNKPLNNFLGFPCKNAKEISERIIGIPLNPNYSKKEVGLLSKGIIESFNKISL